MGRALLVVTLLGALLAACAPAPTATCEAPETLAPGWERSYRAGCLDPAGRRAGGTEILHLVAHKGRLYAAAGAWMDPRNPWYGGLSTDPAWAQILRLDGPDDRWHVDLDMPMHLRPEILKSVTFTTDGTGRPLPEPVTLLLAGAYEGGGERGISLFTRDDASGQWAKSKIVTGPTGRRGEDNSVRAMLVHRDRVTGIDRLFVSIGRSGIFSGVYDPAAPGKIRWTAGSESGALPVRPLAIIEADGALLFSADRAIYRRVDGPAPRYDVVHDLGDLHPGPTFSPVGGIRGLTAIPNPAGPGQSLLFVWAPDNHSHGCMIRLDPAGGGYRRVREACMNTLIANYLHGAAVPYVLGGYNAILSVPDGETRQIVGLAAWVSGGGVPITQTKGAGGFYAGAMYAIRDPDGSYRIAEVNGPMRDGNPPLVATRAHVVSPFPADAGRVLYFGGYDCNFFRSPDTAWIFRASVATVLSRPSSASALR